MEELTISVEGFEHMLLPAPMKLSKPRTLGQILSPLTSKQKPPTPKALSPPFMKEKPNYSSDELLQFIRFFPSHFTLGLTASSLKYRHILDEVILSLNTVPPKYRSPHYNLLGYLFSLQGNYNYAFRYFHQVSALQENNIVSIANQAHCFIRQNIPDKAHRCLKRLINLTSSTEFVQVTKESLYMSDAKTDLGYAYNIFNLNNAAKRMFESALKYNSENVTAIFGLANTLLAISHHENRSKREFYIKSAQDLIHSLFSIETQFLPAQVLLLCIRAERKVFPLNQINCEILSFIKGNINYMDGKIYRDLATIKMSRKIFDGPLGAFDLLNKSLEHSVTAEALYMTGKAHYLKWTQESKKRKKFVKKSFNLAILEAGVDLTDDGGDESGVLVEKVPLAPDNAQPENVLEQVSEVLKTKVMNQNTMLKLVQKYYEDAVHKSYNSNLEYILELGFISGKLGEIQRSADLLKKACQAGDTSLQERAFRYLALFSSDFKSTEVYLREATIRQNFVKLADCEKREFLDRIFNHAEDCLMEQGPKRAYEWIKVLVDENYKKADQLVEQFNKESSEPMKGVNGEVFLNKKRHSRAKMT